MDQLDEALPDAVRCGCVGVWVGGGPSTSRRSFFSSRGMGFWPVPLGNGRSRVFLRLTKVGWEDRYPIKDSRYWKDWLGQMHRNGVSKGVMIMVLEKMKKMGKCWVKICSEGAER